LDDELARVRDAMRRPGYRRRLLAGITVEGGITTIRVLRAVESFGPPHPASIRDVADRLGVEHSTASRAVDTAVRAGVLARLPCTDDQRKVMLSMTDEGRDVLARASQQRQDLLSDVTRSWSAHDIEQLVSLLARLNDDFEQTRSHQ